MGEISDLVKMGPVSRVKQQISADLGTFLDGQTLKGPVAGVLQIILRSVFYIVRWHL